MTEYIIDDEYKFHKEPDTGFWHYTKNGVMMPKKAEKVFKFYALNLNNIDALLNSYFYLSNPATFNDPFDCNINLLDSPDDVEHIRQMKTVKRNDARDLGVVSMTEVIITTLCGLITPKIIMVLL